MYTTWPFPGSWQLAQGAVGHANPNNPNPAGKYDSDSDARQWLRILPNRIHLELFSYVLAATILP
jgi:hypothetical protein